MVDDFSFKGFGQKYTEAVRQHGRCCFFSTVVTRAWYMWGVCQLSEVCLGFVQLLGLVCLQLFAGELRGWCAEDRWQEALRGVFPVREGNEQSI